MLVEPHTIPENAIFLDVGQAARYAQIHIPGARFVDYADLRTPQASAPGACPTAKELQSRYKAWGLTPADPVVVYDDQSGCSAGRLFWILELCSHPHVYYLNGGLRAWIQAGNPVTSLPTEFSATTAECKIDASRLATYEDVRAALADPSVVIWDARSIDEYQQGHMPGARHYEWSRVLDEAHGHLAPLPYIAAELKHCGITMDKTIITHCQSHHRSAFCYMVGRILGFSDIRGYAGSWSEWSSHQDSLIEVSTC